MGGVHAYLAQRLQLDDTIVEVDVVDQVNLALVRALHDNDAIVLDNIQKLAAASPGAPLLNLPRLEGCLWPVPRQQGGAVGEVAVDIATGRQGAEVPGLRTSNTGGTQVTGDLLDILGLLGTALKLAPAIDVQGLLGGAAGDGPLRFRSALDELLHDVGKDSKVSEAFVHRARRIEGLGSVGRASAHCCVVLVRA
ncbi:hypothetical protein VDGD_20740 [Verticillium dahliae]|nr:hypothetical protein VDGD_20740 [Verticillium dahliae]